jgi:hypothetical protein
MSGFTRSAIEAECVDSADNTYKTGISACIWDKS